MISFSQGKVPHYAKVSDMFFLPLISLCEQASFDIPQEFLRKSTPKNPAHVSDQVVLSILLELEVLPENLLLSC